MKVALPTIEVTDEERKALAAWQLPDIETEKASREEIIDLIMAGWAESVESALDVYREDEREREIKQARQQIEEARRKLEELEG